MTLRPCNWVENLRSTFRPTFFLAGGKIWPYFDEASAHGMKVWLVSNE